MATLKDKLNQWGLTSLKINLKYVEGEFDLSQPDRNAAWELYIELLTRITTQRLEPGHGDEKTALDSVYALFGLTREILKSYRRQCIEFTKIAVVVLNQIVRPFTAKWHKISLAGGFDDPDVCEEFRGELYALQDLLRKYTQALADMADVEDLTDLEEVGEQGV